MPKAYLQVILVWMDAELVVHSTTVKDTGHKIYAKSSIQSKYKICLICETYHWNMSDVLEHEQLFKLATRATT